jgi:methylmalonyl-CoA/ethylmalonyl-CoA epimerase
VEERRRLPTLAQLARLDPERVRIARLDGPANRAALLGALGTALDFPAWFGRTWDALVELLRSPDPPDDRAILIVWRWPERLAREDREHALTAFRVAAADRLRAGVAPLVVLVGAGPERGDATSAAAPAAALPHGARLPDLLHGAGRIHHVAVVVRSIEASAVLWRDRLGVPLETITDIASDGVRIAFLGIGGSKIELVEPTDPATGVARFLEAKGEGFHHVCLEVTDLAATLDRLGAEGIELIDAAPRRGAEGPVAFLHPRSCQGVLVELIEAPGGPAWTRLGFGG